ncbi:hypothetical protein Fmac_014342 [Flemingia macrophylla]|uniref:Uncharacterized protein n=1 Tax=Flemingia macrophylla TaxID=520843 RepID=A0ABD1MBG7_9FABA
MVEKKMKTLKAVKAKYNFLLSLHPTPCFHDCLYCMQCCTEYLYQPRALKIYIVYIVSLKSIFANAVPLPVVVSSIISIRPGFVGVRVVEVHEKEVDVIGDRV